MLPYFTSPKQVLFVDPDEPEMLLSGIAYQDQIICGCCGGIFEIADIYRYAPEGVQPIKVFSSWVDLNEAIAGDITDDDELYENIDDYMLVDPNQLTMFEIEGEENLPF